MPSNSSADPTWLHRSKDPKTKVQLIPGHYTSRTGATLISYVFWTWHRLRPASLDGLPLRRLVLSADARSRRANALACHRSQLRRDDGLPILPEPLLAPARRPFQTFIIYGD
jgi:hypothetical protein